MFPSQFKQLATLALTSTVVFAAPTIFMAGDSTMVATGNNDGTEGWGAAFVDYTSLAIVNDAVAGRSARSFTREGRFTAMAANVKSGDYVISEFIALPPESSMADCGEVEFGHNDGGSLTPTDNGRTDCGVVDGNYATTCSTVYE